MSGNTQPNRTWTKSSYSNGNGGNCVEVVRSEHHHTLVRDSKAPHRPHLTVAESAWTALLDELRTVPSSLS